MTDTGALAEFDQETAGARDDALVLVLYYRALRAGKVPRWLAALLTFQYTRPAATEEAE